jgi:prepilin-type N-terminal cleavage/methylation domain-containing protein
MRKAFSMIELLIAITLMGVMTALAFNYMNIETISKENIKTEFQAQLNLVTATILQCKELSGAMPIDSNGSLANNTLLSSMDCNTTTPYALNGGHGGFIPSSMTGLSDFNATQNGSEFYISTSTDVNSRNYAALKDLNSTYSTQQYELTSNATTAYLNFYLSR